MFDVEDADEFEFEFELLNSEDSRTVTLTCHSTRPLEPSEYADALRAFADRIDSLLTMSEVSGNALN